MASRYDYKIQVLISILQLCHILLQVVLISQVCKYSESCGCNTVTNSGRPCSGAPMLHFPWAPLLAPTPQKDPTIFYKTITFESNYKIIFTK